MNSTHREYKLFIGGISARSTTPDLIDHFNSLGQVKSVKLKRNRQTGRCLGYGYLELSDESSYRNVL